MKFPRGPNTAIFIMLLPFGVVIYLENGSRPIYDFLYDEKITWGEAGDIFGLLGLIYFCTGWAMLRKTAGKICSQDRTDWW